jgi:hypothetical protein
VVPVRQPALVGAAASASAGPALAFCEDPAPPPARPVPAVRAAGAAPAAAPAAPRVGPAPDDQILPPSKPRSWLRRLFRV